MALLFLILILASLLYTPAPSTVISPETAPGYLSDEKFAAAAVDYYLSRRTIAAFTSDDCAKFYDTGDADSIFEDHAFVLNTRNIDPDNPDNTIIKSSVSGSARSDIFIVPPFFPRIVFTDQYGLADSDTDLDENIPDGYYSVVRSAGGSG